MDAEGPACSPTQGEESSAPSGLQARGPRANPTAVSAGVSAMSTNAVESTTKVGPRLVGVEATLGRTVALITGRQCGSTVGADLFNTSSEKSSSGRCQQFKHGRQGRADHKHRLRR